MEERNLEEFEQRKVKLKKNELVVQSNSLLERKHKLSLYATLLLLTLTSAIQRDDKDLKEYRVDVTDFAKFWGIDLKHAYHAIENALYELSTCGLKKYSIDPTDGKTIFETLGGFICYGRYKHGEGYAVVRFAPELKSDYIALKENFTAYALENIKRLYLEGASSSVFRTYEIVYQYRFIEKRRLSVFQYKDLLGLITRDKRGKIIAEKYKGKNYSLVEKILEPSKQKINACTDLTIDYKIIGRGASAEIEFIIKSKTANEYSITSIVFLRTLLGIGDRTLTTKEEAMFKCWTQEWNFSDDLIKLAYDKTVDQIHNPNIDYMNAIMNRWHNEGINTLEAALNDKKTSSSFEDDEFIARALARGFDE